MADYDDHSEASLDSPYDMIDDISDISDDDHDTASLLSNDYEDDGQLTPDESIVDLRDARIEEIAVPTEEQEMSADDLLESCMSQELETPRQSTFQSVDSTKPSSGHNEFAGSYRLLFLSEQFEFADFLRIVTEIASCLLPVDQAGVAAVPYSLSSNDCMSLRKGDVHFIVDHCLLSSKKDYSKPTTDLAVIWSTPQGVMEHNAIDIRKKLYNAKVPIVDIVRTDTEGEHANFMQALVRLEGEDLRATVRKLIKPEKYRGKSMLDTLWDASYLSGLYQSSHRLRWHNSWLRILCAVGLALLIKSTNVLDIIDGQPANSLAAVNMRREVLTAALIDRSSSFDAGSVVNMDHLLPYPKHLISTAQPMFNAHYQGLPPNIILISLPKTARKSHFWWSPSEYPAIIASSVGRSGKFLEFNRTELIDGIYRISIPVEEAHGVVTVNMTMDAPRYYVVAEHNFGRRALGRKTYERASTELMKTVNKDIILAKKNARSLRNKVGLELSAGATATKNVTSELAVYIARDLQVLANTAVSVFVKAAAAGNNTATAFKKELIVLQRDLIVIQSDLARLTRDVQTSLISKAKSAKALIPAIKTFEKPLVRSKKQARRFTDVISKRYIKDTDSISKKKGLSVRLQSLFNSNERIDRVGRLKDVVKCARAGDYRACRKAQKVRTIVDVRPPPGKSPGTKNGDTQATVKTAKKATAKTSSQASVMTSRSTKSISKKTKHQSKPLKSVVKEPSKKASKDKRSRKHAKSQGERSDWRQAYGVRPG